MLLPSLSLSEGKLKSLFTGDVENDEESEEEEQEETLDGDSIGPGAEAEERAAPVVPKLRARN